MHHLFLVINIIFFCVMFINDFILSVPVKVLNVLVFKKTNNQKDTHGRNNKNNRYLYDGSNGGDGGPNT